MFQPVLGGDPGLSSQLSANLIANPEARFCWLVDEDDPLGRAAAHEAAAVARDRVEILTLPAPPPGVNPKLFKLDQAFQSSSTVRVAEVVVVLDDDTFLPAATLTALCRAVTTADLVTALPCYRVAGNLPSRLLAQFVNDNSALTYLPPLSFFDPVTINGMCYAVRASQLMSLGGVGDLLGHLTDDLAVARKFRRAGLQLTQLPDHVEVATRMENAAHYVRQMHRWFLFADLLLRTEPVPVRVVIGLFQGTPALLLWGALVSGLAERSLLPALGVLAGLALIRGLALAWVQSRHFGETRGNPVLSLLSELLQPFHLVHAWCQRTILWRTRRYRVYSDQRFEPA